jgi:hypothetical protein
LSEHDVVDLELAFAPDAGVGARYPEEMAKLVDKG